MHLYINFIFKPFNVKKKQLESKNSRFTSNVYSTVLQLVKGFLVSFPTL